MLSKEEIENLAMINEEKLDEEISEKTKELENEIKEKLEERGCDDIYHDLITDLLIRTQDEAYKIGLKEGSHFEEIKKYYEGEIKMKLNKNNADIVWAGKKAWFRNGEVIVETGEEIKTMTMTEFRNTNEEAFEADEKCVVEYGNVVIGHTLCKDFHDPLFKAIDTIEGCFAVEGSPGKLAEKLYKIEFPKGVATLEFGNQVVLINSFEDGLDEVTLFNHLINQAGKKYNLSADEVGRYSLVPPLEWDVIGYKTKIYPVSDEIYKLYQELKSHPDDVEVVADDFIKEPMDFKVRVHSEFMGEIELDLSDRKDKIGFLYNMLSMVFGTKGSRDKIIELDKKYNLKEEV